MSPEVLDMTARSPRAFVLSSLLHASFVLLALVLAFAMKDEAPPATQIFEVVAGEGNFYDETEAPALGVPGGEKLFTPPEVPATPVRAPEPEPEPAPVARAPTPAPVEPVPDVPKPVAPKPEPKPVDLAKLVDRVADRREANVLKKAAAQRAAAEKAAEKKRKADEAAEKKAREKMTYDKFNAGKAPASQKAPSGSPIKTPKIDAEGIAGGVRGGSTANNRGGAGGTALSRAQQDALMSYFAMLKTRLRVNHEKPVGVSDLLSARVEFHVGADGTLSRVMIIKSSGNAEFDRSVIDTFTRTRTVGPRPDKKGDTRELEFGMVDRDG